MNKIYKTIWNKAKRCLSVVSELAKSHSGTGTVVKATTKKAFLLMSFLAMLAPQVVTPAYAYTTTVANKILSVVRLFLTMEPRQSSN